MSLINGFINKIRVKTFGFILIGSLAIGCNSPSSANYDSFGAKISADGAVQLEDLLKRVGETDTIQGTIKATIDEVCQAKGCWMTLNNDKQRIRVTFKDYGFFVPKDVSGREVILTGVITNKKLDEDLARHYAEDAGKEFTPEMLNEVSIVASGVLIRKESQL